MGPSPRMLRRALKLATIEGVLYALMFGLAESYFMADAIRLGSSAWEVALLMGVPLLVGGMGAWVSVPLAEALARRRPLVLAGVFGQALVLFGLSFVEALGRNSSWVLLIGLCGYHGCGQLAGASWSSWFGDLVPARIRGRFFSIRSLWVQLSSFVALVAGGLVLQRLEDPATSEAATSGFGFALLFAVAGLARVGSGIMLVATPEPKTRLPATSERRSQLRVPLDPASRTLLPLTGLLHLAVYFGAPFFTPYMLEQLRFDYLEFTAATAIMVAAKVVYLRTWGQAIDRYGAVSVYRLAVILVAVIPLPWIWTEGLGLALIAQAMSGFSWAAHDVAQFTLLLEATQPDARPKVYALHSLSIGIGQVLGGLFGALLLHLQPNGYATVFAVTAAARLAVALVIGVATSRLAERVGVSHRTLLFRVIGLRPHGGLVFRPIFSAKGAPIEDPKDDGAAPRL